METEDIVQTGTNEETGDRRPERIAAEELAAILKYLELNNDMMPYLSLYRVLTTKVLDGIQVSKKLRLICEKENISFLPERAELLAGYNGYQYMLRKWKQLERREKRRLKKAFTDGTMVGDKTGDIFVNQTKELPKWDEVSLLVGNFALPVWEHVCKGELFVGEWMPELGRFLD